MRNFNDIIIIFKGFIIAVFFLLILSALFWSGNFVIGRYVHADIHPLQLALFRWLGAAIFVLPIFIRSFSKIMKTLKNDFIILTTLSLLGIALFNTLLYLGLQHTNATNGLLINSFTPIIILILSYFILKINISKKQLSGVIISTIGVIFLILRGDLTNLTHLQLNPGDLWIIMASLIWAFYSVLLKFKPKNLSDLEFFTTILYLGLLWIFIFYYANGFSISSDIVIVKNHIWVFVYLSLFTSVLSFYFWHKGIDQIGANKTGQFAHLMPLFGSILAYIFLGEKLHPYHIFGAFLIGVGIYLSFFSKRTKERK